jgi:hypothetical protein
MHTDFVSTPSSSPTPRDDDELVVDEDFPFDEVTFEAHSGYELKDCDEFDEKETRQRVERRLAHAAKIKADMMAITDAEIELQAKLFDDKVKKVRADWELNKTRFQPHSGVEDSLEYWLNKLDSLSDRLASYSEALASSEVDAVVKHVERLIILFVELREVRTYTGMMAAILGYLQGLTERSLFNTIREYLANVLAMESHDGYEDDDPESPSWLGIFRSITSDWKSITRMPAWRYVQRILSLAVSAGLAEQLM